MKIALENVPILLIEAMLHISLKKSWELSVNFSISKRVFYIKYWIKSSGKEKKAALYKYLQDAECTFTSRINKYMNSAFNDVIFINYIKFIYRIFAIGSIFVE